MGDIPNNYKLILLTKATWNRVQEANRPLELVQMDIVEFFIHPPFRVIFL